MNSKKKTIITLLILVLLIAGSAALYSVLSEKTDTENLASGEDSGYVAAPDFTVYDKGGSEVHLSDFRGDPVFITFWASWCGVCKAEMPDIQKAYEKYGDDVRFMMINVTDGTEETMQTADDFLKSVNYTFPVYYDTTLEAGIKYGASSLPSSFFINSRGDVIGWANYIDYETICIAIEDSMK